MSYPTSIEQLKEWIEGPLEVREGPACSAFVVEKDGSRQTLEYIEFTNSGFVKKDNPWQVGQIHFSKQDALTAFWYHFQRHAAVTGFWHCDGIAHRGDKIIYWRVKPEIDCQNGAWFVYARFCITDCDWPLAEEPSRE